MEKSEKIERLKALLSPVIGNRGAFLVDVSLKGDARRELIEVYCETENGITIDECAGISREILPLVDSSKIVGNDFRLEVSSPGVGIPLKDKRQFRRNIGKLMSVKYHDGFGVKQIEGDLTDLTDQEITIAAGNGLVKVDLGAIEEAVVKIRW
ncbi:MAG: ribosome maturation factor RimP [Candidatus Kryptoniota bacterium]